MMAPLLLPLLLPLVSPATMIDEQLHRQTWQALAAASYRTGRASKSSATAGTSSSQRGRTRPERPAITRC